MFNLYPYKNLNDFNLDYILKTLTQLQSTVETFIATETVTFADPILWNIARQYAKNTIVLSNSGDAYLSKQTVPVNIQLDNSDYWQEIFNFADYVRTANSNLTFNIEQNTTRATHAYAVDAWLLWDDVLYKVTSAIAVDDLLVINTNIVHFTVEDFIKAFMTWATNTIQQYKNDIDASELAYRQQLAQDIADTTASLQAQLNLAISGATVDSEVINARLGANGITYSTLGDAIKGQITDINNVIKRISDNYQIIPITFISNEYIDQNTGAIISYNGWDRTDYIPVTPNEIIRFNATNTLAYSAIYDSDHNFISRFTATNSDPLLIPDNGAFIALSGTTATVRELSVFRFNILYTNNRDDNLLGLTIPRFYVSTSSGTLGDLIYNVGYSTTDYINVDLYDSVKITATASSDNNAFYDEDKNVIRLFSLSSGNNIISIPLEAKYIMLSGVNPFIDGLIITPDSYRTNNVVVGLVEKLNKDINGKYFLSPPYTDMIIGKQIDPSDGSIIDNDAAAITSSYYKLINNQNKFIVKCPVGYGVYIHQYTENGANYDYLSRTPYLTNGSKYWAVNHCTHIRIEMYKTSYSILYSPYVIEMCNNFMLQESNVLNKYLRVCTFNQAADYPHFLNDNLANTQLRVRNYLNFIGEYNPDVLCAQEAVGVYFQPVAFEIETEPIFNRKYIYRYQPGYQRKIWTKYNFAHQEQVIFTSQYAGDQRFYGKETIYVEDKEIVILNAHCAYQGESDFEAARKGQFEELANEMSQHEYCICCGDFNAWSADEFDVFSGYNLANCGEYGVIDTWYVGTPYPDWPFKAVDNIITTPNIKIQNVIRGPYDFDHLSDHAPLIADLQIR